MNYPAQFDPQLVLNDPIFKIIEGVPKRDPAIVRLTAAEGWCVLSVCKLTGGLPSRKESRLCLQVSPNALRIPHN